MANVKQAAGRFTDRIYTQTKVTFGIVSTICTTAIGLWFLGVIGLEATIAHTIGDFIRLVGESA